NKIKPELKNKLQQYQSYNTHIIKRKNIKIQANILSQHFPRISPPVRIICTNKDKHETTIVKAGNTK
ncbi:hypothetical protein, partial [Bacteroides stercorirosoris]|uniref:hypothetical protein n=1 Tax=Bacteroides stercorirosoris TaxID=871324 RepID=UPI001C6FDF82